MANATDVFLSHDWGIDEKGRDNHDRVSIINHKLDELGYRTWFDEEKIMGDIDDEISEGIEQTKCVIVFMTRQYHNKVNSRDPYDHCRLEFNHAKRMVSIDKMVAVVMEPCMTEAKKWTGQIGMYLGGKMYINMSKDLMNKTYLKKQMKKLQKVLQSMGIRPINMKNDGPQSGIFALFYFLIFWAY